MAQGRRLTLAAVAVFLLGAALPLVAFGQTAPALTRVRVSLDSAATVAAQTDADLATARTQVASLTATVATRDATITATRDTVRVLRDSLTVLRATLPPPAAPSLAAHPNEPAGFRRVLELSFANNTPVAGRQSRAWDYGANGTLLADATAPVSSPSIFRTRWPKGMTVGNAPLTVRAWDTLATNETGTRYRRVYVQLRVRIPTKDFEGHAVLTKLWYVGFGNTSNDNDGFIGLRGNGSTNAVVPDFQLAIMASKGDDREGLAQAPKGPNRDTRRLFTCGVWHDVEVFWDVGTVDHADGVVRVWIDGVLTHEYTSLEELRSAYSFTQGIFNWQWTPVYGGMGGAKTRDDVLDLDHVYISGGN